MPRESRTSRIRSTIAFPGGYRGRRFGALRELTTMRQRSNSAALPDGSIDSNQGHEHDHNHEPSDQAESEIDDYDELRNKTRPIEPAREAHAGGVIVR